MWKWAWARKRPRHSLLSPTSGLVPVKAHPNPPASRFDKDTAALWKAQPSSRSSRTRFRTALPRTRPRDRPESGVLLLPPHGARSTRH
ncbi:hypothetical protein C8Q76DRAFT_460565 [Earliella scabrosa]|nr:hypothetical protein C8Q76DRAFT_460565 [Earliella scabrosa]